MPKPDADILWRSGVIQGRSSVILYPDNSDKNTQVLVMLSPNKLMGKWVWLNFAKKNLLL